MRCRQIIPVALATAACLIANPPTSPAQTTAPAKAAGQSQTPAVPATAGAGALGRACDTLGDLLPPDPNHPVPRRRLPIDDSTKSQILHSGLPCAESVDTNGPDPTGLRNLQHGFDFVSWRTFIALNSPADGTNLDIEHSQSDTPTQWEDMKNFKQLLDVMLPPGQTPKWPDNEQAREDEKVRLMPAACVPQYKTGMMVIKMIEETFNQPFKTGPLIDQDGHYALFDILMNKAMFHYIERHQLFSKAGQREQIRAGLAIDFPSGQNPNPAKQVVGDAGAIMIKVSWKILNPDEIRSRKFHMVYALVQLPQPSDPNVQPPCLPETLGLVGFHVVHKTLGRPQWIWTSFEHVDNVPEQREVDAGPLPRRYSFFDHSCSADKCSPNQVPPWPWEPDPAGELKFHGSFNSQITRVTALMDATVEINTAFQKLLNHTVWQNYMLINTQWPSNFGCTNLPAKNVDPKMLFPNTDFQKLPDMTCAPAPTFLANSTLETYSQGDVPQASSSCMACHGNATDFQNAPADPNAAHFNQSDFTFMLEKAQ
ncbi:hypothetical protein [Bradyrhizobium genosp. P]|uniref:hypothetical protein n=1 Tax=Bradyrhizobium genosp. P TaxID=83641 RepID=UPI003CF47D14